VKRFPGLAVGGWMWDVRPAESLKHAIEHRDPYNPRLVWLNFRGLFRGIDEGNAGLNIPAYNGGLFAADPGAGRPPGPGRGLRSVQGSR
jgi:hypothetical protein